MYDGKTIAFKFTEKNFSNPNQMQALTLAYIGDSIYDIMSREYVMKNHLGKINELHKKVSTIVSARAQASFMENMLENNILTEDEEKIYNRAKNQKTIRKQKMQVLWNITCHWLRSCFWLLILREKL